MTKQKLFFSYSRVDGSPFALRLAVDLKKRGFDVWIDQEDIRAGMEWDIEIEKALETCDCVLFLETEKSVVSNNVLDEVYYALEQNKKVIPLIYVDSRTPFRLKRLQHIDFTKNYDTGLIMLVNELEGNTPAVVYKPEENAPVLAPTKPFYTKKNNVVLLILAILVMIITAVIVFTAKNKSTAPAETKDALASADTITGKTGELTNVPDTPVVKIKEEEGRPTKEKIAPVEKKRKDKGTKATAGSVNVKTVPDGPKVTETATNLRNLHELIAGEWTLTGMEPKARSQSGYLKIEGLGENKATIKSYIRFFYPVGKGDSYLTVFNAFAGCNSCTVNKVMKLIAEDIAVGSHTIKKLKEDQADGRKAGEVILDAGSNKSIRGTVTLQFVDEHNAVIKVKQPLTIELENELMLEPFEYTFRFTKTD